MRRMSTRVVRAVAGALLVLVSYPLVLAGGGLWLAAQHRGADGAYTADTQLMHAEGYALVVPDVDALLRTDAPFARGGRTDLSLTAAGPGGPLFIGLAPYAAAQTYLAGVASTRIDRVRPARGPWPVDTTATFGPKSPEGLPSAQPFWVATSTSLAGAGAVGDALTWAPTVARGQRLTLVIMNADTSATVDVRLTVALRPNWLVPMIRGLLIFSGMLLMVGFALLVWSGSARKIVYVLDEPQLAALAVHLRAPGAPDLVDADPIESADNAERVTGARRSGGADCAPGARGSGRAARSGVARRSDGVARSDGVCGTQTATVVALRPRVPALASVPAAAITAGPAPLPMLRPAVCPDPGPSTAPSTAPSTGSAVRSARPARVGVGSTGTQAPTWAALLAAARPPATPRLLWPPKPTTRPSGAVPVPVRPAPFARPQQQDPVGAADPGDAAAPAGGAGAAGAAAPGRPSPTPAGQRTPVAEAGLDQDGPDANEEPGFLAAVLAAAEERQAIARTRQ